MAVTVREAALVPRVLQQAFHLMRSGRPVRYWWIYRSTFRLRKSSLILTCTNRCRSTKPAASRMQIEKAVEMLIQAERPVIVAGGRGN